MEERHSSQVTHSTFETNKNVIFSKKSLFVGVEPHVCWATLMISVVLTANFQAFHKQHYSVSMIPKHRGVYPNMSVCNYPVEGKQSRQNNHILEKWFLGNYHINLSCFCPLFEMFPNFAAQHIFKNLYSLERSLKPFEFVREAHCLGEGLAENTHLRNRSNENPHHVINFVIAFAWPKTATGCYLFLVG